VQLLLVTICFDVEISWAPRFGYLGHPVQLLLVKICFDVEISWEFNTLDAGCLYLEVTVNGTRLLQRLSAYSANRLSFEPKLY
jgi:hypothetical protein